MTGLLASAAVALVALGVYLLYVGEQEEATTALLASAAVILATLAVYLLYLLAENDDDDHYPWED
jgi:hypothetical protein